ncbi:MAG: hypothetical protein NVS3B20_26050 [Polyangiales bacterium]
MRTQWMILSLPIAIGCGSSKQSDPPKAIDSTTVDAGFELPLAIAVPPRRSLREVGIVGSTSIANLLIDPQFSSGQPGIGRWMYSYSGTPDGSSPTVVQLARSDSPEGIAMRVGTVSGARGVVLTAQVVGGSGPYLVSLWASANDLVDDAQPLALLRVAIAGATGSSLTGVEIKPVEGTSRRIGDRTWTHFMGEAPGPYTIGAYLIIRLKASNHNWWFQAPQVVPKVLLGGVDTRSLVLNPILSRSAEADELAAIEQYRKQPLVYGPERGVAEGPQHVGQE